MNSYSLWNNLKFNSAGNASERLKENIQGKESNTGDPSFEDASEIIQRFALKDLELFEDNLIQMCSTKLNSQLIQLLTDNKLDQIEALFYKALESPDEEKPDALSFTLMTTQFCLKNLASRASMTMELMIKMGHKPNVMCYNAFLEMYRRQNNMVLANKWLHQMKMAKIKPNKITYNIMISLCLDQIPGDLDKAHQFFYDMREQFHEIDSYPYGLFIRYYSEKMNDIKEALKWARKMEEDGIKNRDAKTKQTVVKLYKKWKALESKRSENKHPMYMLKDFVEQNLEGKANDLWIKMKHNGVPYDSVGYALMIQLNIQNGRSEKALDMYDEMCFKGLKADRHLLQSMYVLCTRLGQHERCVELLDKINNMNETEHGKTSS